MCLKNGAIQQAKALWSRHHEIYALQFCCVRLEPLERPLWREGVHFPVTNLGALEQSVGWFGFRFFSLNEFSKIATSLFNKRHQNLLWEI